MDPLFPELPENLSELTDDELAELKREHEIAAELLDKEDEEFTKGLSGSELVEQYKLGLSQMEQIVELQKERLEEQKLYQDEKAELAARREALSAVAETEEPAPEEPAPDGDGDEEAEVEASEELAAEVEIEETEETEVEEPEVEVVPSELVAAARKPVLRRPPSPAADRKVTDAGAVLIAAAGQVGIRGGSSLDRLGYADALKRVAQSIGTPTKNAAGIEQKFLVASAQYRFPEERKLLPGEPDANARKIQKIVPMGIPGVFGNRVLTASGGLCAPLEPIYSMPNFASSARPVRDALPSFQAERGGVNVPTATYIGDITSAISLITEAEDALGGTYATKSCQDLTCPDYTEVAVTTIAHCREYGNLNARAWPEKIAHENDLTMAAHAATAESYLLDRIKSLSLIQDVDKVLGTYADLVRALLRARSQIVSVLRMSNEVTFRALMPEWILDELAADTASTQFDRFQAQASMAGHLRGYGFQLGFYKDEVHTGTTQKFAATTNNAQLPTWPADAQIAVFPEGEFLHIDSGTLELGLVRDSTLNSTNDFQIFGESFENVARLGPAQGALWLTPAICATGEFPSLHAAYDCGTG